MYRIFDNVSTFYDLNTPPCLVDYKKDVTSSIIRKETFDHGRLITVEYVTPKQELILDVKVSYKDATGDPDYPLERTTVRKWYDVTGVNHNINGFDITTKLKKYNPRQTTSEGIIRRRNITDSIFNSAISLGYVKEATDYMKTNAPAILAYEVIGDTEIIDIVNADKLTWLSDKPKGYGGLTMKQIIVGALTI
jgi:hypothetical protein